MNMLCANNCGREKRTQHFNCKYCEQCRDELAVANNRLGCARYRKTDGRKQSLSRYNQSPKKRVVQTRYNNTSKARDTNKRYEQTPKGQIANQRKVELRRVRRLSAEGLGFPTIESQQMAIVVGWGNACCYCEAPFTENSAMHIDHIIPLARGGTHHPENLAPACQRCNSSKHSKLLSEWRGGIYAESVPAHAAGIAAILRGE